MNGITINADGVVYDKCPRCSGEWVEYYDYFYCINHNELGSNKCITAFGQYGLPRYTLLLTLSYYGKPYTITYRQDICVIAYRFDQKYREITLPILPFNITAKKLQTYLAFV